MADGEDASFELLWPAEYPDWSAAGQDATDQLNNFGISIEPRAVTQSQQPIDVDKGSFELAIRGWGNSSNPHPHFSYTTAFFVHNTLAINNGGQGTQFPLVQETASSGEVDLEQLTVDAAQGLDEAAQQEHVAVIASVFNELLPSLPLWERYGNNSVLENERVGEWPPDENPVYRNSPYADGIVTIFMLTGQIAAVQE
jgi:peptide/nickel transport system substrate-binding protein